MRRFYSAIWMVIFLASLLSCGDNTPLRRKVSGKAGDVVVVIPKETWEGQVGEAMRKVLQQPQLALPQDEPIFNVIDVPPAAFQDLFKTNRNVINVRISPTMDSAKVEFKRDVWAWPQSVVNILAKTQSEFIDLFNQHSDRIVAYLLKAERERLQMNYAEYQDKTIFNLLKTKYNIEMDVPNGFTVAMNTNDFLWVRYDTPEITQSLVVYTFPYVSDSTFTLNFLLSKRDSVLKQIEGPLKGSYMTTEHLLPPLFQSFEFKKNYAAEMRGLWKVQNDYMGGPFINLSVLDQEANRVVVIDGFVYAPSRDKRNFLRQVEAIAYSLRFPPDQDQLRAESTTGK